MLQQIPVEFTREMKFLVWRVVKFSFCNTPVEVRHGRKMGKLLGAFVRNGGVLGQNELQLDLLVTAQNLYLQ